MKYDSIDTNAIRKSLKGFDFRELFIEQLGWNIPKGKKENFIEFKGKKISYSHVAELKGVPVLKFEDNFWKDFQDNIQREKLHRKIEKRHTKHLIIFSDNKNYLALSYSFRSDEKKDLQIRTHSFFKEQNGDTFINKLSEVHVGIGKDDPSIGEISKKLDMAFNTEKVTKKFYKDFKSIHLDFQKYISGIKNSDEKSWYSSVILNRLMFIWFLQKKGFVDNDTDYLRNKFDRFKAKNISYYSNFLKILFFEGFSKKQNERSQKAKNILGDIKYLNGGLFVPHPIEEKYKNKIDIKNVTIQGVLH